MPKIEVNEKLFFQMVGQKYDYDTLEKKLTCGKAELDEKPDMSVPEDQRVIKIELNDTNRPDLWSTNGVARQLRLHNGGTTVDYSKFLSREGDLKDSRNLTVTVDPELKDIRPYMVAFMIEGKAIDEPMLLDIIQTQEKLAWNFGRKRKSLSMGLYRASQIKWPVHYKAVDPDNTSFIPLTFEKPLTCRQILTEHPKGKDYGWILENFKKFPLLTDDAGEVMSMAPVINSATLGAVQVGDKDLMVELTGDNMANLLLAANIVACDFADCGYTIHPIRVDHPYDTGFGKSVCAPFYFQQPAKAVLKNVNKLLGSDFSKEQVVKALEVMGNKVETKDANGDVEFTVYPAPYRNDFLHEVDIIEDVMIGIGLDNFKPAKPNDFTIGRLMPLTLFSRQAKNIMVGLGYQEMIFNYLGSKKDYIERMGIDDSKIIEVSNPMSENYQFVRPSIIPSLLRAESGSANAIFPHKIFEIGKVAYLCDEENTGTRTRQSLGFMTASSNANFNSAASEVSSLLYFLDHEYKVAESDDPRFIPGRQAAIIINGKQAGIFGEIHPQVLENWSITVPCVAGEIDVEELMAADNSKSSENAKKENSAPKAVVNQKSEAETNPIKYFNEHIELRVAKIEKVDVNPEGDKLYIETMDDGSGTPRIIQSGLRPYLKAEELIGQHVIIASNLAPRKMKGVESHGMLLACDYTEDGKEKVELLTAPWAKPGTIVCPAGSDSSIPKPAKIDIDHFCKVTMKIENHKMVLNGTPLTADGKEITTVKSD
ncbi:MAG: phenylalanine--tRNA ligase subunit beta, partial [Spirochaetia bacterium]|nr:phenylalanine--tRNA ligase subunit beta [Spirochaetia bacterium]